MKALTEWISQNPAVSLIVMVVGLVGSILGILADWKNAYDNYLSKTFAMPVWGLLAMVLVFVSALIINNAASMRKMGGSPLDIEFTDFTDYITVAGETFGVEQVEVDGKRFVNYRFEGSELVFRGKAGFSLEHNAFIGAPKLRVVDFAGVTFHHLEMMKQDPVFAEMMNAPVNHVRPE